MIFAGMSGTAQADAAGLGIIEIEEMKRDGFDPAYAAAVSATSAIIGPIIPPSVIMVIYGIMTETSIGALFAAGVIPGLVATGFYLLASFLITRRHPDWGPPGERASWGQRLAAMRGIWGVLALFALVMGGMYGGFFTPTEAAGVGAAGGFLFALARRALTPKVLFEVLGESARTSAMLFTIVIGASLFANFLNFTALPSGLKDFVIGLDVHPVMVVVVICLIYVVLGTAMESLSMMLLTVPIFFPLVTSLGFDPVWFGIIVVCVIEISLITPPVGMNIFVLSSMMPSLPTRDIWRGVMPFIGADIARMFVLVAFPPLALFLPRWLGL